MSDRLRYTRKQAAYLLAVGVIKVDELRAAGHLVFRKDHNGRLYISHEDLVDYRDSLPSA